jgi:photosystem II stability/assembly factor-like uncharacterized protein
MKSSHHSSLAITRPVVTAGVVIAVFSIFALHPRSLDAQWKAVLHSVPSDGITTFGGDFATIYFLDLPGPPRIGFVCTTDKVYKTTDGGFSWHSVSGIHGSVAGWTFKDSLTGWSATNPCYKTTDGGETWFPLNDKGFGAIGIYYDSTTGGLFFASLYNQDNDFELVSWDEGMTWQPQRPAAHDGFAFANCDTGIQCGIDYDGSVPLIRTTDGGHTWQSLSCDTFCYEPLAIWGTNTYFIFSPFGTVMRSDDAGVTWRIIYSFPIQYDQFDYSRWFSGSSIFGDEKDLYVTTLDGCYHSTDTGNTWNYLCGMSSEYITWDKFYAKGHTVFMQTINDIPDSTHAEVWRLNIDSMQYFPTDVSFANGSKLIFTTAGNAVKVNYALTGNDTIGIDTGHLVFHYDPNALLLEKLQLPPSWVILDSSTKNGVLDLTFTADSNEQLPSPIVQLTFGTYLSGDSTKIYLDSVQLSGHRLNCGCEALSLSGSDSVQVNFQGCGDSILLAAMSGKPLFTIESIQPNPAQNEITVQLSGNVQPEIEMYDALGRSVLNCNPTTPQPPPSIGGGVILDVSNVPSGIYFVRVSAGGYVESRSVVVEH